jgi:hypothetical protein
MHEWDAKTGKGTCLEPQGLATGLAGRSEGTQSWCPSERGKRSRNLEARGDHVGLVDGVDGVWQHGSTGVKTPVETSGVDPH